MFNHIQYHALILFAFLIASKNALSQQDGYKELKIGHKLFTNESISKYKFLASRTDTSVYVLVSLNPQKICDEIVDRLVVKVNSDSTIETISVYTVEFIVKDYKDFLDKYLDFTGCINNTVGKADYFDDGTKRSDARMQMSWLLNEDKITMSLFSNCPSVLEENVKRSYKLVWYKSREDKKMW